MSYFLNCKTLAVFERVMMGFLWMGAGGVCLGIFASRWEGVASTFRFRAERDREGVDVVDRGLRDRGVSGECCDLRSLVALVGLFNAALINFTWKKFVVLRSKIYGARNGIRKFTWLSRETFWSTALPLDSPFKLLFELTGGRFDFNGTSDDDLRFLSLLSSWFSLLLMYLDLLGLADDLVERKGWETICNALSSRLSWGFLGKMGGRWVLVGFVSSSVKTFNHDEIANSEVFSSWSFSNNLTWAWDLIALNVSG